MSIVRAKNLKYGELSYKGNKYNLIFGHPIDMLKDNNISWETKGYLSYIASIDEEIELSAYVTAELIHFGYLKEVE